MFRHRLLAMAAAAAAVALAAACTENLQGGRACPTLCPNQNVPVQDSTFDGLTVLRVDTTVTGFPALGTEPALLVARGGDSLDIRGVIRFDSIPYLFRPTSSDTLRPATIAFQPYLRLRLDSTRFKAATPGSSLTVEVYDVDTAGNDTAVAVLASLFRPDRFLGVGAFDSLDDSVRIPLDSGKIAAHVRGDKLVRVGLRLTGTGRANILNAASGIGPVFSYRPDTDTTKVAPFVTLPRSTTPASDTSLLEELANYPLVVLGSSPPIGQRLDVGGMPARRVYIRFNLPTSIIDSATVVRATLTLHSVRYIAFLPNDSLTLFPQGVIASSAITDPTRAALFVASNALIGIDSIRVGPNSPDSINVEIVNAVRRWAGHATDSVTRAIVLRIADEGANPLAASYFAAAPSVPPQLRPHVHLSYVRPSGFGLP